MRGENAARSISVQRIPALALLCLLALGSRLALAEPPEKPVVSVVLFTRTLPNGLSEIEWRREEGRCRVITNIDCAKLAASFAVENAQTRFDFFVMGTVVKWEELASLQQTGAVDASGVPKDWPKVLPPATGPAQYVIGWDGQEVAADTPWLEALHRHYDQHRAEIVAAWQARERQKPALEAAARERAQRLEDEAKAPPTQVRVVAVEGPEKAPEPAPTENARTK